MKRSTAFLTILLAAVLLAAVLSLRIFLPNGAPERAAPGAETAAPTAAAVKTLPPATVAPVPETPPPTVRPAQTPPPTERPLETRAPIETPAPPPVRADGSFRSVTGTGLNLLVEWTVTGSTADSATVLFVLSAESYSFRCSPLWNSLALTVGGTTYTANSPDISYDGEALTHTQLATFTVTVPRGQTAVSAVWHYRGTYSGKPLEDITAGGTITLG